MRVRLAVLLALVLLVPLTLATAASAFAGDAVLAQQSDSPEEDSGEQPDEGDGVEEGSESSGDEEGTDPGTETGAGEGEEGAAAEETGPVWTYQMARISIALLFLLLLAIGGAYYRFVAQRRSQGI